MSKLQLNLDDLSVDSFQPEADTTEADGTVHGRADLIGSIELQKCGDSFQLTCGLSCGGTCNSCFNTCNATCGNTCGNTCDLTCGQASVDFPCLETENCTNGLERCYLP